ncbi:ribosomal RNA-processing protein 7-domain-containing protein [Fimicolochytrium jonesii]|uniref:ribosomal RNA-processing protein 7-domain-containing protein n=1 Tax=Fimicolochytrium jonesii TaxID=1396493 RepID=UPI0022FED01B|nr:ribosomal RNA-processing protein 7-domain-containing protein [Fimicolochytrium jonesii]KAI8820392.1 ribosomal RNA-processing protein 7-domain-containing protein [Fimicolochytrium jonesii]
MEQKPTPAASARAPAPAGLAQFGQFKVLPITMPPLAVATEPLTSFTTTTRTIPTTLIEVTHEMFIRAHEGKKADDALPAGRALFAVNVPADASERHFARLFRRCGRIERVVWHDEKHGNGNGIGGVHKSGSNAHIIFTDREAVARAVGMKARRRVWSDAADEAEEAGDESVTTEAAPALHGLSKWLHQHALARPNLATLQQETDTTLVAFEDAERDARLAAENKRNVPDEDGFVTVVRGRGKRNVNVDGQGASVTAARPEEVKKLKPKKLELVDFYRFQMRESKRNQLADLRRKFEEDKLRIQALKASRRFKPY